MKKVTIKNIAALTGYNPSTVSRSLNDNENIPIETREKIKKVASELNYSVNLSARNLSKKKSNNLGVFMQKDFFLPPITDFTNIFLSALNEEIQKTGYNYVLYSFNDMEDLKKKSTQLLNSSYLDGLILFSKDLTEETVDFFQDKNYPYVLLYYGPDKYVDMVFGTDNYMSGKIITEFLLSRGLKNIATITSDITPSFSRRTLGYRAALSAAEVEIDENHILTYPVPLVEYGEKAAEYIFKNLNKIHAVFAQHDLWAFGLIKRFNELGVKIPEDISIIGHDNLHFKSWFSPLLTSFSIERNEICKNALEYLIHTKINKEVDNKIEIKKISGKIVPGSTVI